MKRKSILLLAGMLLLTCSACGKNEGSGQAESLAPPVFLNRRKQLPEHVPSAESEVSGKEPLPAEGGDGQGDSSGIPGCQSRAGRRNGESGCGFAAGISGSSRSVPMDVEVIATLRTAAQWSTQKCST